MQMLVVADLHYTMRQLDWIAGVASEFDVLVLGGDELDVTNSVPLEAQILVMRRYLVAFAEKTTVLVNSGNHDLDARAPDGEKVASWLLDAKRDRIHIDGESVDLAGVRFTICPWWDGPLAQARVEAQLETDLAKRGTTWVWVYHSPPEGPLSWTGQRHFGDEVVEAWIRRFRPELVFTGHVHQSPFTPEGSWAQRLDHTWVFNPGRQTADIPAHLIVDLDKRTAIWWSPFGSETLRLEDPTAIPVPV